MAVTNEKRRCPCVPVSGVVLASFGGFLLLRCGSDIDDIDVNLTASVRGVCTREFYRVVFPV
jgi:hypothetical protein